MTAGRPSRSLAVLATLAIWAAAGGGAWLAADAAATEVERRSAAAVGGALALFPWAAPVRVSGLQVVLSGTAPDEVARFRALEAAAKVVDAGRLVDRIEVAAPRAAPLPDFAVELLRNDAGISLIGLLPANTDRAEIVSRLRQTAGGGQVRDLLQEADHPAPPGWEEALAFALSAAEAAGQARISVAPGQVGVTAVAPSPAEKARLETALKRAKPDSVALLTTISTPRPVIAPFLLRFVIDADGGRFDACAADSENARDRILTAAAGAGAQGKLGCTLGLGAPTPQWGEAAAAAVEALGALGAGTVTMSDADIALDAPMSVAQSAFDAQVGRLQSALPAAYALTATLEKPAATPVPPEFSAEQHEDGAISLRGRISDQRMREAVESVAHARFPKVDSALRVDPQMPEGWAVRAIAGVEALAELATGSVTVTPDMVRIEGLSGRQDAADAITQTLARRLGAGERYRLAIRYDRRLDGSLGLPDGAACVDRANSVLARSEIGFSSSSAEIEGDIAPTLDALAKALTDCEEFRIEVGGHTDSQGSAELNATLSAERAKAVVAAMAGAGIAASDLTAAGYGETVPVADNDTEAGRDANRRIEFRLLSPEPATVAPPGPPVEVGGVTGVPAALPDPAPLLPARVPLELAPATPQQDEAVATPAQQAADRTVAPPELEDIAPGFSQGDLRIEILGPQVRSDIFAGAVADQASGDYRDGDPADARPAPRPGQ